MNIIITGAGRGIGYETVKVFCNIPGTRVLAVSRNIRLLQELELEVQGYNNASILFPVSFDLGKRDLETSLLTMLPDHFRSIDILINNAGLLINKRIEKLTAIDFDVMFAVNTKAPFLVIQSLLPFFNKPSHIINIGSMGGIQGSVKFPGLSLYSSAKAALAILTECLAEELKDRNIHLNCLALGAVQTEMLAEAFPGYQASVNAVQMAEFIVNFALHAHKNINGKIIPVSLSTP